MGFNRLYDRITQIQGYEVDCNLEHGQGYDRRILSVLFPTRNTPIPVNE